MKIVYIKIGIIAGIFLFVSTDWPVYGETDKNNFSPIYQYDTSRHTGVLFSIKYSDPLGVYLNTKGVLGKIEEFTEVIAPGMGLAIDGGIGTRGYKVGLGLSHFLYAGEQYFGIGIMGYGVKYAYQKAFDWEEGETGIEFSLAWVVGIDFGYYQAVTEKEAPHTWRLSIGFGF